MTLGEDAGHSAPVIRPLLVLWSRGPLFSGFGGLASVFPTRDPRREVLDISVPKLLSGFGGGLVSLAARISAVGNDQRLFILGQNFGEFFLIGFEVNRARNMTLLPCFSAIGIKESDFFGRDVGLEFFNGDVGIFAGIDREAEEGGNTQCNQFFHNRSINCV